MKKQTKDFIKIAISILFLLGIVVYGIVEIYAKLKVWLMVISL